MATLQVGVTAEGTSQDGGFLFQEGDMDTAVCVSSDFGGNGFEITDYVPDFLYVPPVVRVEAIRHGVETFNAQEVTHEM